MSTSETVAVSKSGPANRAIILLTVSLCTMLYALTMTIVNVVLPQLQGALSATPDQISWVVTLNVLATAIVTPMTGWLVARFGQRQVLIWSVAGFSLSSLLCATATTLPPLLLYRIAQGALGAPLVPLAQAIIVSIYPPAQRAMAQGIFGMSVVIGPAIAPALGGYLAEEYGWRWIFLLILPLGLVALLGVLAFIRDGGRQASTRLDWTGFILLSLAVSALQFIMDRGQRLDWFESEVVILLVPGMGLSFYLYVVHTATAERPFISPALFLDRNFSAGLFLVFVYGMLNLTPLVLWPSMLQNLMGFPDSLIGTLLGTRGAGMVFGFLAAARMGRLDPRIGIVLGLVLIGLSGWQTAAFDFNISALEVGWIGIIQGFGCGLMWVPLSVVTFATLPDRLLPDASAIFHLLRNFGSSIFISLSVLTIVRTGSMAYAEICESINPSNTALAFDSLRGLWSVETTRGLGALAGEVGRQASLIGYTNAFLMYALACVAALPLMLFIKIKQR
ncbi:MAG: DHA2 family efflux MFS transporter permease subunit [Alphaproteobacteria bacterium]|jgi:DHA2 family multidrug resistance protein|nr:DHA2 family efflux MFS transporter permease subunit [Alphaproteobacteria bacterium]